MSWTDVVLLIGTGAVAGMINAVAGGGSLLTMPMLIVLGLTTHEANATARLNILLETSSSVAGYRSKGISVFPFGLWLGLSATAGAVIGVQMAVAIDAKAFQQILATVMVLVAVSILFRPKRTAAERQERMGWRHQLASLVVFFFIGIYGGFIQAGVGFPILAALSFINRFNLVKANSTKSTLVLVYTIAALALFYNEGLVRWSYGLIMAAGSVTAAWITSRYAVRKGDRWIKRFLVVAVCGLAIKLWFF